MRGEKINCYECDYDKFAKCLEVERRIEQERYKDKGRNCRARKSKKNYYGR